VSDAQDRFLNEYIRIVQEQSEASKYVGRDEEETKRVYELDEQMSNLLEEYADIVRQRPDYKDSDVERALDELESSALGIIRTNTLDPVDVVAAHTIINKPIVDGINREAIRVSGVGNRFGTLVVVSSGKQQFAIGAGNRSMNAFTADAGFSQVVSVEETIHINGLRKNLRAVNANIENLLRVVESKGRMTIGGANPYVGLSREVLREKYIELIGTRTKLEDEIGGFVSRYYTDVVLPNGDSAYTRLLSEMVKHNPDLNLWTDKASALIYAQYPTGRFLPLANAFKAASNVGFLDGDTEQEIGEFILKRVKIDDHSYAEILLHKPSNRTVAVIPPIKKRADLEKILNGNKIDMLFIDARYSSMGGYYASDPILAQRTKMYLSSQEIGNILVSTYQDKVLRPESVVLTNIDYNLEAGTVAKDIESGFSTSTKNLKKAIVKLSPVSNGYNPDIFTFDGNEDGVAHIPGVSNEKTYDDIIRGAMFRRRERDSAKATELHVDLVHADEEQVEHIADTVDDLARFDTADLDIPGEEEVGEFAKIGLEGDAYNIVGGQEIANTSAEEWIDLNVRPKDRSTIESRINKFKLKANGVGIKLVPEKGELPTSKGILKGAVISQAAFDQNIDWQAVKNVNGSQKYVSSTQARVDFINLIRDYTWETEASVFDVGVDWIKHKDQVLDLVVTSDRLADDRSVKDLVKILKGRTAKEFTLLDRKIVQDLPTKNKKLVPSYIAQRKLVIDKINNMTRREIEKSAEALRTATLPETITHHKNNIIAYTEYRDWANGNQHNIDVAIGNYQKIKDIRGVKNVVFTEELANGYMLDGLRAELHSKFEQLTKINEAKYNFDSPFEFARNIDRVKEVIRKIEGTDRVKAPQAYTALVKELDNVMSYFNGVNRAFVEPSVPFGFDVIVGGRVAKIMTEIKILQPPMLSPLHPNGPFKTPQDFMDFQADINSIDDMIREDTVILRDGNDLKLLVNKYFKLKVNTFAKELEELEVAGEVKRYNAKLEEAADFVMSSLGYMPTEERRFVLLDLANIEKIKHDEFVPKASMIFARVDEVVKKSTTRLVSMVGKTPITESKAKVASNNIIKQLFSERETLSITLNNRIDELTKLESRFAAIAANMPKEHMGAVGSMSNPGDENTTELNLLDMRQLKNRRLLVRDEMSDLRTQILKIDLDKFNRFDATDPSLYTSDILGTANAIRAGKINPEAIAEVSDIISVIDYKNLEKSRLMIALRKIQELHEKRRMTISISSKKKINDEIFEIVSSEMSLSDTHKYKDVILPSIELEWHSDSDIDKHIAMVINSIDYRIDELDTDINRAEKAVQRLKGYAARIDTPFKNFVRESIIDDPFRSTVGHIVLHLNAKEVTRTELVPPSLVTGRDGGDGLPFDLMKKFGLSGNRGFLFPDRVGKLAVYKLHVPMSATPGQIESLIVEAERQAHHRNINHLVVEFPADLFRGYIPDPEVHPKLYRYFTLSNADIKKQILTGKVFSVANKPIIIGAGYQYEISPDINQVRRFRTIIAQAQVEESAARNVEKFIEPKTQQDIYDRIKLIVDDIGTPGQRAIINGELQALGVKVREDLTPTITTEVVADKAKGVDVSIREGENKLFSRFKSIITHKFTDKWALVEAEFPVIVYVDQNNNIRSTNLGVLMADGSLDPHTKAALRTGKGYLPHDAQYSVIIEGGENNRFRIGNAAGTLPKEISFNSIVHTATQIISSKTRTQFVTDFAGVDAKIQTSFDDMDRAIARVKGLSNTDLERVTQAEELIKENFKTALLEAGGERSKEIEAIKEYRDGMRGFYQGLLNEKENMKWYNYVKVKNAHLGEAGQLIYGIEPEKDGEITVARKISNAFGVSVWFDRSVPVQSVPTTFIDVQIKDAYALLAKEPHRANELYAKLDALKTARSQFVNVESRTLLFNPSLNAIYNNYIIRQLIDVDLKHARQTGDLGLQARISSQIELIRNSIKQEEELASKIRAINHTNSMMFGLVDDRGQFLGAQKLFALRQFKESLTPTDADKLRRLEQQYMQLITYTSNQTQLAKDIDNMLSYKVDASNIADWFKLRHHVAKSVYTEWRSNLDGALARVLPKSVDFKSTINGTTEDYVKIFTNRDTLKDQVADTKKLLKQIIGKYKEKISSSGVSEYAKEFRQLQANLEALVEKRTKIIERWTSSYSNITMSGNPEMISDLIIKQLHNGIPIFDDGLATRMKYVLRARLDELGHLKNDGADVDSKITSLQAEIEGFDAINKENMLRGATRYGLDKTEQEIVAIKDRLAVLTTDIDKMPYAEEMRVLNAQVYQHEELLVSLNSELSSVELRIKNLPSVIATNAQFIHVSKIQRLDQIAQLEQQLGVLNNNYSKASGEDVVRIKASINKVESEIVVLREAIVADADQVKEAEENLAKNILQYDEVKVANSQYIRDQIAHHRTNLYDAERRIRPEIAANIKKLEDTLHSKDLRDQLVSVLTEIGVVQSERRKLLEKTDAFWYERNRTLFMGERASARLAELDGKIVALRSRAVELSGQMSTIDPFYTPQMLGHDVGVLKKVYGNLIKAITPVPYERKTVAEANLLEMYVKKYVQTQFQRKFDEAAVGVGEIISSAAVGKKVKEDVVAGILTKLKTKSISDFVFLDGKFNDEFIKEVLAGDKPTVDVGVVRGQITVQKVKISDINLKIKAYEDAIVSKKSLSDVLKDRLRALDVRFLGVDVDKPLTKDNIITLKERIKDLKDEIIELKTTIAKEEKEIRQAGKLVPLFVGMRELTDTAGKPFKERMDRISAVHDKYILKDIVVFIESQKIMVPSAGVWDEKLGSMVDVGKMVPLEVEYDLMQQFDTALNFDKPLKNMVEGFTERYADKFDVVSVDRFKLLTLLSRGVDKKSLMVNIRVVEKKAHDLNVALIKNQIDLKAAQDALPGADNLQRYNLGRRITSLSRKQAAIETELSGYEELVAVGKAFNARSDDIVHLSKIVPFKEDVLSFLQLSLAKDIVSNEMAAVITLDQDFVALRVASEARAAKTVQSLKDSVLYHPYLNSDLGEAIRGVVDGIFEASEGKDFDHTKANKVAIELEQYLRSVGININSTFKVKGWNIPKLRKAFSKMLIVEADSPVFTAALRQVAKKNGIVLDEFAHGITNSLFGMSGVSKDHYGRVIVGALRNYMGARTYEFVSAFMNGSVEVPFFDLYRGLSTKEAEEFRNLFAREETLIGTELTRYQELKRIAGKLRVAPKYDAGDEMAKAYVRAYGLDDGTIVIASNEVVHDVNYAILEPRFRILKVFHEKPYSRVEKYLFENYSADRQKFAQLLIDPKYDSRGLVASVFRVILKEKFNITVDPKILDNPDVIFDQYREKLSSISLSKMIAHTADPEDIVKSELKINPARWVDAFNDTGGSVQEVFLNMVRASGVNEGTLRKSDEWYRVYQPKISAYGTIHTERRRIGARVAQYEADMYVRVNGRAPQGVQIGLNPKSFVEFLLKGTIGEDVADSLNRYKQLPGVMELIKRNNDRKVEIEALLKHAETAPGSISIDGGTYTIDSMDRVFKAVSSKTNKIIDDLYDVGIVDPSLAPLKDPKHIDGAKKLLDRAALNSVNNTLSVSYKYNTSIMDDVLEKIAINERKLNSIPFTKVEFKLQGDKKIINWIVESKLSNGTTVNSQNIKEELVKLRKVHEEVVDIAEKRMIQADIDRVQMLSDILDDIYKLYAQKDILDQVVQESGGILKHVDLYKALESIKVDQETQVMVGARRLDRIKVINQQLEDLRKEFGDVDALAGQLTSEQKAAKKLQKKLLTELNGGIDPKTGVEIVGLATPTPAVTEVIEQSAYGGLVRHTVDELRDELKLLHSSVEDLTSSIPKLEQLRIFQKLVRPVQYMDNATGPEMIKNIETIIGELNNTIAVKNNVIHGSMPNRQKYITNMIIASTEKFEAKIKALRQGIEIAKTKGKEGQIEANRLLVELNNLVERLNIITTGKGKMFIDSDELLTTSTIDRDIVLASRGREAALKRGDSTMATKFADEVLRLQKMRPVHATIEQIDLPAALNKIAAFGKKTTMEPADWAEYQELVGRLNRITNAGLHIEMNAEQIRIFDRMEALFLQSKIMGTVGWMELYKKEWTELITKLDEVSDTFMGARYINSTYHNLGLMMQRDMSIDQILLKWSEDAKSVLDPKTQRAIELVVKPLDANGKKVVAKELAVWRGLLNELENKPVTDDKSYNMLLGLYTNKVESLETRLNGETQRGFRKYNEVFQILENALRGGVNEEGQRFKGLVPEREAIIEQLNALNTRISEQNGLIAQKYTINKEMIRVNKEIPDLNSPLRQQLFDELDSRLEKVERLIMDDAGLKAAKEEQLALQVRQAKAQKQIDKIEATLKLTLNKGTVFYQGNVQQFKNVALAMDLDDFEADYIKNMGNEFSESINKFLDGMENRVRKAASVVKQEVDPRIITQIEHLRTYVSLSDVPAIDAIQAVVDEMTYLGAYSIPNGEELTDTVARYKVAVEFWDSGPVKWPTTMLTDYDSSVARLTEARKEYERLLAKLKPGVEMTDIQIQAMNDYFDRLFTTEATKADRKAFNLGMEFLSGRGFDWTKHPSLEAGQAARAKLIKQMDPDMAKAFINAENRIKKMEGAEYIDKNMDATKLLADIKVQSDIGHARARIAKYRAEVMLLQNMSVYNDVEVLTRESKSLINARDLLSVYKDVIDSVERFDGHEIKIPGKAQVINVNTELVKKLANTFERNIYITKISNGVPVRELVESINKDAVMAKLTDERMRILRNITNDISNKVVKATGDVLEFTDENIRNAYALLGSEGVVPVHNYFGIADISKDGTNQFVPVINGSVILPEQKPLGMIIDTSWRDPFAMKPSTGTVESQLLSEYLKSSLQYSDNMTIQDTFKTVVNLTMVDKVGRIAKVMREGAPYESTILNTLNKAVGASLLGGVMVAKVSRDLVRRVDLSLQAVNGFVNSLLDGVSKDSVAMLYEHAAKARSQYQKGAKYVKWFGGHGDIGSLLKKMATNAGIKHGTSLFNIANELFAEETRRTMVGLKNIVNTAASSAYFLGARATSNSLEEIATVAQPIPWKLDGEALKAMWSEVDNKVENWQETMFDKRADTIINRLLGRVNKAGNDMNRKMSQGVMPALAVGGATKEVQAAYTRAGQDLEGLISDSGYTALNQVAMSNFVDNADQIRWFEYTAINDSRTCKYCRSTHGVLYRPNEPRPELPRHPNCRCVYRPWFKSVSNAAEEMEAEIRKPRVAIGQTFNIGPDDFAGFGDGLSKLVRPVNADGTISDEDWIMWFNKQPFDIRQMMVGDVHNMANALGVFGVDSPVDKKAFIVNASKNIAKTFAKDMTKNTIRQTVYNTLTDGSVLQAIADIASDPKNAASILAKVPFRRLMFKKGGVLQTSSAEAFNRSVGGLMPIDPNEIGPLQMLISRITGDKTVGKIAKFMKPWGTTVMAKLAHMTPEEWATWGPVLGGDVSPKTLEDAYARATGNKHGNEDKTKGAMHGTMQAFDAWFNVIGEGLAPMADMSIASRTKIFEDLAKDIAALPEIEAVNARLRGILRNKEHVSNNMFTTLKMSDDAIYRMQDSLSNVSITAESDAIPTKEVLDIYGQLMRTQRSSAKGLLEDEVLKERLVRLPSKQRTLLVDTYLTDPTMKAKVQRFFIDTTVNNTALLEAIRIRSVGSNGVVLATKNITSGTVRVTIGPDGKMYNASKQDLEYLWRKIDPKTDTSKFVSMDINIGGNVTENPAYLDWQKTVGANLERKPYTDIQGVKTRKKAIESMPTRKTFGEYEYEIVLENKDDAVNNRSNVQTAIMNIDGVHTFSASSKVSVLLEKGVLKVGEGDSSSYAYKKKYSEAIIKIESIIDKTVRKKDELKLDKRNTMVRIGDEKIQEIATLVRSNIGDILNPKGEFKDVHTGIKQFVGDVENSEAFLNRIRIAVNKVYNV
jgi:SPP1 gp7 family putative phage head morphogenesis protein